MLRKKGEHTDYWLSYADLMTGMLMVFVLLFCFVMISLKQTEAKIKPTPTPTPTPKMSHVELKKAIIQEIAAELKKHNIQVEQDINTGDINIASDGIFSSGKSDLSEKGKSYLKQFAPDYFGILNKPKYIGEISEILIEGHTDLVGNDISNMKLSQDRAQAAYEYIFGPLKKQTNKDFYSKTVYKVSTAGYGYHKASLIKTSKKDDPRLRRISFRFRLKYEVVNE
jgi:chemotaxis protein MotB